MSALINFLIVAAVIYFIIVIPYKKLKELDTKVEEEETQLTLLTEIRDLLAENGALRQAWRRSHPRGQQGDEARHGVAPAPGKKAHAAGGRLVG